MADDDGDIQLPSGATTSDAVAAAKLWRARAEEEALRCVALCRERAAAHRQSAINSGASVDLAARAREADKCADKIAMGAMPDGAPTTLALHHASLLANRDQLVLERDRARHAYAELHASHRALMQARDDNARYILELRDRVWALEAALKAREPK
ncbi:hypothetical protein Rctr197k_267 [Virus Rctr197k]|nr:hypothetical protein Rctr197k_267 [Virus Rctr197k]